MAKKDSPTVESLLAAGLIMRGNDPRLVIRRLPSDIPGFDDLLGGGWPAGRYTQIVGPESTGKTVLLQYAVASQQHDSDKPLCLIIDHERGYDAKWWAASGVDVDELLVAQPMYGEEAIEVILGIIRAEPGNLGLVGVDSIAAMYPHAMTEPDKGAEQHFMGTQAHMIARFFAMITPEMDDIVFILLNQMRANLKAGSYEETYPGGWAMRHNNHVTLRTRREGWISEGDKRVGFSMEVINKKNKVGGVQGESITIPFHFKGQIDMTQSYIDEALERKIITARLPYYKWGEVSKLGKAAMRQHLIDNPEEFERLKAELADGET